MMTTELTDDTKTVLLLCGHFGARDVLGPLDLRDYNVLAEWLRGQQLRPADLLKNETVARLESQATGLDVPRVRQLLQRGAALALSAEKWLNKGIWVISRGDDAYPPRLRQRLGRAAPPLLFGVGDSGQLASGGLAIVGSREADERAEAYTAEVGRRCAAEGISVVSGGARGIDQQAVFSALSAGGRAVVVLADSLLKCALSGKYRDALRAERVVIVSPYNPDVGFNVGNAMSRNKLIYALADHALVVSTSLRSGGTWAGAQEELTRKNGVTVFVRTEDSPPPGNSELLKLGARPFPPRPWTGSFRNLLRVEFVAHEPTPAYEMQPESTQDATTGYSEAPSQPTVPPAPKTIYEAVFPILLEALASEKTPDALAKELCVVKTQLNEWLKRAVKEAKVRKLSKPVRYVRIETGQPELDLGN